MVRLVMDRAGLVVLLVFGIVLGWLAIDHPPVDALIYWTAGQTPSPYGETWGPGAFYVYPPPLAQALRLIPWPLFVATWMPLLFVAFWVSTRAWSLPVFLVSAVSATALGFGFAVSNPAALTFIGNPQILITAVCVLGFRWPGLWAFPILTKIAPGVGLLWFVARREWRNAGVAAGVTAVIVAVSVLTGPADWARFLDFAFANARTPSPEPVVPVSFALRLPMSMALVVWGARHDRRWTVPIAVGWSAVALYEWSALTIWIGALPLLGRRQENDRPPAGATPRAVMA